MRVGVAGPMGMVVPAVMVLGSNRPGRLRRKHVAVNTCMCMAVLVRPMPMRHHRGTTGPNVTERARVRFDGFRS